ncbi:hypothetical protein DFH27DRAFT_555137 [Peziza echinospora]|nr:hypothetical protein DFH27DRAFT_555137 [Peziza echinospora]
MADVQGNLQNIAAQVGGAAAGVASAAQSVANVAAAPLGNAGTVEIMAELGKMRQMLVRIDERLRVVEERVGRVEEHLVGLQRQGALLPILLHNSTRDLDGRLSFPTGVNREALPQTRAELYNMDARACRAAATALGLPILEGRRLVQQRRNQIAEYLGVERL